MLNQQTSTRLQYLPRLLMPLNSYRNQLFIAFNFLSLCASAELHAQGSAVAEQAPQRIEIIAKNQPNMNHGRAQILGLGIEAKLHLQQRSSRLPAVELHANLNRNWSKLERVPGPDNRLAQQTGLLINLGADYSINPSVKVGADYSFQAADNLRESLNLSGHTQRKRLLDLYMSWQISAQQQLRFSATNLLHQATEQSANYSNTSARWTERSQQQAATTWRLLWGTKW